MPNIDPRVTVPEGQVIHKKIGGHNHDGIVSSLIDTSSYSIYDFTMGVRETNLNTRRGRTQQSNELAFKSLVVAAVEERILNPKGITLKANSITSNEIAANTIKADNLSANLVLVNNIIRSNNYQSGPLGANGWIIYSNGKAEFNDVTIRGNIVQGNGNYQNNDTKIFANSTGYFSLGSNFAWNGSTLTINGSVNLTNTNIGTFDNGDALTDGYIGGIDINANEIQSNAFASGSSGFRISSNGNAEFNNVIVRGTIAASTISGSTLTTTDGGGGVEISGGYIKATNGAGVRIKNSDDTAGATVLFKNDIYTLTSFASLFTAGTSGNSFAADGNGIRVETTGNRPIDLKRNYVANADFIRFVNSTSSAQVGAISFNGTTGIKIEFTSDFRLKTNIVKMVNGIDLVKKINPVEYEWINTEGEKGKGFIAQELYEVYPDAVSVGSDDVNEKPWGVDYGKLTPLLTAAVKELIEKVEYLENRLNQIEGL